MELKKKNWAEKIINLLLNILIVIFGLVLLISIYTGVQTKILGNKHANFFGYSIFEVQTGSMADVINAGDCIIIQHTQKVKLNDIVTYELKGEYITHRIIEVYKGTYITKGDANNAKDEPVDQKQIVGKVVSIWAHFGIFRKTLFNPSVLIALIITLFLFNLAFKKNKNAKDSSKPSETNKKDLSYIIYNVVVKKVSLLWQKIKDFINNKKMRKNRPVPQNERKNINDDRKLSNTDNLNDTAPKEGTEEEEYYKDEDDLDKTSFYRVIPVDANEVDEKFKNVPTKEEVEEYYKDEDELDKTSLYRIIPVDATEVNDTLLEIANNEIKDVAQKDKNQTDKTTATSKEGNVEIANPVNEALTNVNLDLLKSLKSKKSKNIIDAAMLIKKEELNELISILVKDDKTYSDKETIKEEFINTYIDAKYYNYYGDKDIASSSKKTISKMEKVIKEVAFEMINDYHGKDSKYNDNVNKYVNIFILLVNIEQAKDSLSDLKVKNEFYKKEINKYAKDWDNSKIKQVIDEITKAQKKYNDTLNYFLEKLNTNMFDLNISKLTTMKDMYGLKLQHNISFSKVYSDYIIDKTYAEGIIAEDKMEVLLTLLSVQLAKDMISYNYNRKYILCIPNSLYPKTKKIEKLLRMIDDKYAKENVIILILFNDLLSNKNIIQDIRRMGYKFALIFNEYSVISEKNRGDVYIADYIFASKKIVNMKDILPFIPEDLLTHIIDEDITDKVGDLGGE